MSKSQFSEENTSSLGLSLQPREQRLAEQIAQLLESFEPMHAVDIARRLKEKNILVLSLLDKLAKQGDLHRLADGRFSLSAEEVDPETSEGTPARDTSEPANRLAQVRFMLYAWQWLHSQPKVKLRMNRGIEASVGDQYLLRVQIGAAGVPTMEVWSTSKDGSPQLSQSITVWGEIQAERAKQLLIKMERGS